MVRRTTTCIFDIERVTTFIECPTPKIMATATRQLYQKATSEHIFSIRRAIPTAKISTSPVSIHPAKVLHRLRR